MAKIEMPLKIDFNANFKSYYIYFMPCQKFYIKSNESR